MSEPQKVWLVTGASSGLGQATALAAAKAGHKVIACARNPDVAAEKYPDIVKMGSRWLKLDISDPDTEQIVAQAVKEEGRVDCVVNNAGFTTFGSIEDWEIDEMKAVYDVLFFGQVRVLKGVLPTMRAQQSGIVFNMSSIFGFSPIPNTWGYSSAKFALEGLSEVIAWELAPFNIRVAIVEPGLFNTAVMDAGSVRTPKAPMRKEYQESFLGFVYKFASEMGSVIEQNSPGDPAKLGQRLVEYADDTGVMKGMQGQVQRLTLGTDALACFDRKLKKLQNNYELMKEVGKTTDYDGTTATGVDMDSDAFVADWMAQHQPGSGA